MRACVRMRTEQRGAATLEMMFAFPIIFLVLICGLMLGYYQYAKTALVWHVFSRTENLATRTAAVGVVDSAAGEFDSTPPAGLTASTQSYSFAVPVPSYEFSFTVACHATPLQIPHFDFGKAPPPAVAAPPVPDILQRLDRFMRSVKAYASNAGGVLDSLEDIRDDTYLVNQVFGQFSSNRPATRAQGVRLVASWALEGGMEMTCARQGKQVIVARAVAWNEKTKTLKKAGVAQFR